MFFYLLLFFFFEGRAIRSFVRTVDILAIVVFGRMITNLWDVESVIRDVLTLELAIERTHLPIQA